MSRCHWISYPEDVWHGWPWFRTWILLEVSCIFGSGFINIHNFRFLPQPKEPPGGSWKSWRRIGPVSTLDSNSLVEVCGFRSNKLHHQLDGHQPSTFAPMVCIPRNNFTSNPTSLLMVQPSVLVNEVGSGSRPEFGVMSFVEMIICVVACRICPMNSTCTCVMDSSFHGMCLFNHLVIQLCARLT